MSYPLNVLLAVILLWFPVWAFHAPGARLAGFDQRAWPKGRNVWLAVLDALRAAVGSGVLVHALPAMARLEPMGRWQEPLVLAVAIGVGATIQMMAWRDEDHALAPVPYLLGAAAVVAHPVVLAIALPLALGSALALRAWSAGLLAAGLGFAGVGLVVEQQDWRVGVLGGLAMCLPVLVSVMAGRHLGWPRK